MAMVKAVGQQLVVLLPRRPENAADSQSLLAHSRALLILPWEPTMLCYC
jgi:hypothetical protein